MIKNISLIMLGIVAVGARVINYDLLCENQKLIDTNKALTETIKNYNVGFNELTKSNRFLIAELQKTKIMPPQNLRLKP